MLCLIAGARPNFVKLAPVCHALTGADVSFRIVHTGQHYDDVMSQTFFDELEIPEPDVNLGVGGCSAVRQITETMCRLESVLLEMRPRIVVVFGDVNAALAGALAAVKLGIPVAHVEAGLRCGDRSMPEEINRIVVDSVSTWLFTSEPTAAANLQYEGAGGGRIHPVGNVMIDSLQRHRAQAEGLRTYERFGLEEKAYAVLTLHRPENVDDRDRCKMLIETVGELATELPVVFVMHPRTRRQLPEHRIEMPDRITESEPLGYREMLSLVASAKLVLTDSGGLQEETTALGVRCITLRETTERPITLQYEYGTNLLAGWSADTIRDAFRIALRREPKATIPIPKWDGHAAERIVELLRGSL